jgi:hypothetical protein
MILKSCRNSIGISMAPGDEADGVGIGLCWIRDNYGNIRIGNGVRSYITIRFILMLRQSEKLKTLSEGFVLNLSHR